MPGTSRRPDAIVIASWVLAGVSLLLILELRLLSALFAGLLVFELVHLLAPLLQRRLFSERSRLAAVVVLATLIVAVLSLAIFGAVLFFRSDAGSLSALLQRMADILDGARESLPPWVVEHLPTDAEDLRITLSRWLRAHSPEIELWGTTAGRVSVHIVIGMIIGAIVSLREAAAERLPGPLSRALTERAVRVGDAFRRVVFAQVRISAINTVFSAIYLLVVLPAFGVHLPLRSTLLGVTFVAGLLPVVGNVISNAMIVVVSLPQSIAVALASLAFLVFIHKFEYFLNARIIGKRIHARPWELLIAMLVMESAFGIAGVVAAPVYYAYLKRELADRGLV
jgi:predicted PurR-regulated permease PerM